MHEVEPFLGQTFKEDRICWRIHVVPAHVRDDRSLKFIHDPWPLSEPWGVHAVLDAVFEEHLHPHTNPEDGATTSESHVNELRTVDCVQPSHAGRIGTHTGNDQCLRSQGPLVVPGDFDGGAHPFKCALRGSQVPRPVVKDNDIN